MSGKRIFTSVEIPFNIPKSSTTVTAQIWALQFKFLYYVGIAPYYPVYDAGIGCWTLQNGSILSRLLSFVIIWIPFYIVNITQLIKSGSSLYNNQNISPKAYIVLFDEIIIRTQNTLFSYIILGRKDWFHKLIYHNGTSGLFTRSHGPKAKKYNSKYLALSYFAFVFVSRLLCSFILCFAVDPNNSSKWLHPSNIFLRAAQNGLKRFYLQSADNETWGAANYFLGTFELVMRYTLYFVFTYTEIRMVGTIPITMWLETTVFWNVAKRYYQSIGSANCGNRLPVQICSAYNKLKEYSNSVNGMWSTLYLLWLMETCLYMSFGRNDRLGSGNSFIAAYFIFLISLRFIAMLISGSVYKMIEDFKQWLTERTTWERFSSDVDKDELQRMLSELDNRPIGIRSNGVY